MSGTTRIISYSPYGDWWWNDWSYPGQAYDHETPQGQTAGQDDAASVQSAQTSQPETTPQQQHQVPNMNTDSLDLAVCSLDIGGSSRPDRWKMAEKVFRSSPIPAQSDCIKTFNKFSALSEEEKMGLSRPPSKETRKSRKASRVDRPVAIFDDSGTHAVVNTLTLDSVAKVSASSARKGSSARLSQAKRKAMC